MEREKQDYSRKVKIEKLLTNGVIQEEIQDIQDSYARQEFMQAFGVLHQILRENDKHRLGADGGSEGMSRSRMGEIFNVIPFLGERGTGKTSTMLSFAHMLRCFPLNQQESASLLAEEETGLRECWRNQKFVVLDYIDAGILKNNEDIMSIILARMLKYVKNIADKGGYSGGIQAVRQEELRQLYQSFNLVYGDLLNLTQEEQRPEEESALRRLQNLNSSHSLSEAFRKLVQLFLAFLKHNDEDPSEYYLVISLDDIDLFETTACVHGRKKDAYTILGQIYEYLQTRNVIVLVTFDETRLVYACTEHIEKAFCSIGGRECMSQAIQYIQKVILPKYKIYMPSLGYADYSEKRRLSIDLSEYADLEEAFFPIEQLGAQQEITLEPKELILKYLANIYGCYFDSEGKKQHFFEERNLRKIKNLLLALLVEKGKPYEKVDENLQEQRYMHLLSYIYNQFISEKLANSGEITLFREWLSMPVGRRSKEILGYIRSGRSKLDGKSPHHYGRERDEGTYSYGELAHNLYHSSRCGIFSKEMVHCILASYSLVLPRLYGRCCSEDPDTASKAFESLRSVLGTSISGRWSNEILYTTFMGDKDMVTDRANSAPIGSVSTRECNRALRIPISDEWYRAINCILFHGEDLDGKSKENFRDFIQSTELLCMFFTNVRETEREEQNEWKRADYGFSFESAGGESEKPTQEILLNKQESVSKVFPQTKYLEPQAKYACFNILNFVVNSFTWDEFFETLHNSLLDALLQCGPHVLEDFRYMDQLPMNNFNVDRRELLRKIKTHSLEARFRRWANTYGRCAIPFQHFDMTYNILKRQRDAIDHGLPGQANVSEFYACCVKVYENIASALEKQDEFFHEPLVTMFNFKDAFEKNPFIVEFKRCEKKPVFRALFMALANVLVVEESSARRDFLISQF